MRIPRGREMLRITCILNIVFKVAITFVFDTEGLFDLSERGVCK